MQAFRTSASLAVLGHIPPQASDRKLSLTVRNTLTYTIVQSILGRVLWIPCTTSINLPPAWESVKARLRYFTLLGLF